MTTIKQLSLAVAIAALFSSSTVFATPNNDAANTMPNSDYYAATQYKEAKAPLNNFGAIDVKVSIPENVQVPPAPVEAGGANGIPETMVQKWTQAGVFPPSLNARAFILIDANTGQIIASNNANMRMAPASTTKLMLMYIVEQKLADGVISLDSKVLVPEVAWRTGGSRMFLKPGSYVSVKDLIQGVIVESGNDAAVTLANYVAGSQSSFVSMMNATAVKLGMHNTHFTTVMGLPAPAHFSTAYDLGLLGEHIMNDYPQYFHFFSQKYFEYNHIRQPNFNRLLFTYQYATGMKTGSTEAAGYSLVSSAKMPDNPMNLVAVVLGTQSLNDVAAQSKGLFNYGFRFFKQDTLYKADSKLSEQHVWGGQQDNVSLGLEKPLTLVLPSSVDEKDLLTNLQFDHDIKAPVDKGEKLGEMTITYNGKVIKTEPLVALNSVQQGGWLTRIWASISMYFHNLLASHGL
ncbi:D-alanyl-D-alanine carboxypeptidase family protein [Photobacterium angustum]|uniref:D-alanyl-D-alanine carboxypeptidase family protein n=1 Tax=Photobacterium angustum TaxID=661 RepID=UPI0005E89DEB|nr:D-alanyl-D-alanine carboxypeptidase family protein [Photobacterium angustum]KJF94261.1 D-alanyl-D-alanine carboxypeptidase [Photobacterium angustum]PSW78528.1 D-alanyl-D-alanine carboxypeptidase [Photobacterium angustum]